MILQTERLILKPYEMNNLNDYHSLMSNSSVWTYSTHIPHENITQSEDKLISLIQSYKDDYIGFLAMFENSTGVYIGEAGIISLNYNANRCVLGYNLCSEFWGRGYATEISRALVNYAFAGLKIERVEALTLKNNNASCKVLKKSGMQLEGVLRHFSRIKGNYEDVCYYAIISSDHAV